MQKTTAEIPSFFHVYSRYAQIYYAFGDTKTVL